MRLSHDAAHIEQPPNVHVVLVISLSYDALE